jgi:Ala-tRNA(Pro) deacylase
MSISATRRAYETQVVRSDQRQFAYEIITHIGTITAQEVAETQHIPGKQMAKVVMVKKANGTPTMLVLPAPHQVSFDKLRCILGTDVALESADEFRALFPECETGAEPPFGNLFGIDMLVDTALTEDEEIVFNAGSRW